MKNTLYFGNSAYISLKLKNLVITPKEGEPIKRSIEDTGVVVLDHPQITITHQAIRALQANNVVILSCDEHHMPMSMMLPLEGHTLQSKRHRVQLEASLPLRKNLWQQTVIAKVINQATVLDRLDVPSTYLRRIAKRVLSGDSSNVEAQAAAYYWKALMGEEFVRDRYGDPPNNLLNYGYAIVRSMIARAVVSSGLIPTLGIHHKNQYNAYCLADDLMEPYRPFVDLMVIDIVRTRGLEGFLSRDSRTDLLAIATVDTKYGRLRKPLMVGMALTSSSLVACYEGAKKKILYPTLC